MIASESHSHEERSNIFLNFEDVEILLGLIFSFGFARFGLFQKFGSLVYLKYPKLTHIIRKERLYYLSSKL